VFWQKKNSVPVKKLNYLQFYDICGYKKKGRTKKPPSLGAVVGSGMDKNPYPG
jgi:hypothetical protein